jgi:hypothetical protein
MIEKGFIYILKHRNGHTVKVGETKRDPEDRLRSYVREYELEGFSLHKDYEVPLNARKDIENISHRTLRKHRLSGISGAIEIFACTPEVAENAVEEAIKNSEVFKEEEKLRIEQERRNQARHEFDKEIEKDWQGTQKHKKLKCDISNFLSNNQLEKTEPRGIRLFLGVFLLVTGILMSVGGFGVGGVFLGLVGIGILSDAREKNLKKIPNEPAVMEQKKLQKKLEKEKLEYMKSKEEIFYRRYKD